MVVNILRSPRGPSSTRAILNFVGRPRRRRPWASDRNIIWLAMMVVLIGGINTLILLAWVPSDHVQHASTKGWNIQPTQSTDPMAHPSTTVPADEVQQIPTTMTPHRHQPGQAIAIILIFTHYRNGPTKHSSSLMKKLSWLPIFDGSSNSMILAILKFDSEPF